MNNLRKLRVEKNVLQEDVGNAIGVSGRAIGNYETEKRKMSPDIILKLSEYFNVSSDYLLGKTDIRNKYNFIYIPLVNAVKAKYNYLADVIDKIKIESSIIEDGKDYFALRLKGTSMSPAFVDGDIVVVQRQNTCENNEFAIVCIGNDEGILRKIKKTEQGIVLQPLNPAYEPLMYTNEEINSLPITIIGIVKKLERKF